MAEWKVRASASEWLVAHGVESAFLSNLVGSNSLSLSLSEELAEDKGQRDEVKVYVWRCGGVWGGDGCGGGGAHRCSPDTHALLKIFLHKYTQRPFDP
jgi:hypothetical protein